MNTVAGVGRNVVAPRISLQAASSFSRSSMFLLVANHSSEHRSRRRRSNCRSVNPCLSARNLYAADTTAAARRMRGQGSARLGGTLGILPGDACQREILRAARQLAPDERLQPRTVSLVLGGPSTSGECSCTFTGSSRASPPPTRTVAMIHFSYALSCFMILVFAASPLW